MALALAEAEVWGDGKTVGIAEEKMSGGRDGVASNSGPKVLPSSRIG